MTRHAIGRTVLRLARARALSTLTLLAVLMFQPFSSALAQNDTVAGSYADRFAEVMALMPWPTASPM